MPNDDPPEGGGDLSFDRADYAEAPGAFVCAACKRDLSEEYWQIGGVHACTPCKDRFLAQFGRERGAETLLRAGAYGFGAALVGAFIWWAVRVVTKGTEFGIIALLIGYLVGRAVRMGSGGRGGARYQALAMFLTYSGVAFSYVPDLVEALSQRADGPISLVVVLGTAYAVPFLRGTDNVIGLLIIAYALYEAWKLNRGGPLPVSGPFRRRAPAEPPIV